MKLTRHTVAEMTDRVRRNARIESGVITIPRRGVGIRVWGAIDGLRKTQHLIVHRAER